MKSNGLLKWLMIPVALLVLFVAIRQFPGGKAGAPSPANPGGQLTVEEMKALGIEGDTPRDTVATLVGQVKQLRTELQTALSENKTQREETQRLRQRENAIDQRIGAALESERSSLRRDQQQAATERQQTEGLLADLQRRLASFGAAKDPAEPGPQTMATAKAKSTKPVFTAATNSTLMGSVAMTALIGRVPIDGTVNDPYPFKVLVGPDNLAANGIDLPELAGAVFSGTASGDWTLSCVRGQVRSITYVFHDGTIRTIPEDREGNQQNGQQRDGLGWISDPHGVPCVSGERRSNAQQYLGSQALITAAGAGVASLIKSDSGRMSYVGADGSIGSVGISGNEAVGRVLACGVRDMAEWVNKLYGQAFAAIYVQPGAKVAIHLDKPLAIDHDPEGRKVDHRIGESHALELD